MSEWLSDDEQHTWGSVLRMHAELATALAEALKIDSDMSSSDYEVLAILSEATDGVLRARAPRCELRWEKAAWPTTSGGWSSAGTSGATAVQRMRARLSSSSPKRVRLPSGTRLPGTWHGCASCSFPH